MALTLLEQIEARVRFHQLAHEDLLINSGTTTEGYGNILLSKTTPTERSLTSGAVHDLTHLFTDALEAVFQVYKDQKQGYKQVIKQQLAHIEKDFDLLSTYTGNLNLFYQNEKEAHQRQLGTYLRDINTYQSSMAEYQKIVSDTQGQIANLEAQISYQNSLIQSESQEIQRKQAYLEEKKREKESRWWLKLNPITLIASELADLIVGTNREIDRLTESIKEKTQRIAVLNNERMGFQNRRIENSDKVENTQRLLDTTTQQYNNAEIAQKKYANMVAFSMEMVFFYTSLKNVITGINQDLDILEAAMKRYDSTLQIYTPTGYQSISFKNALFRLADDYQQVKG